MDRFNNLSDIASSMHNMDASSRMRVKLTGAQFNGGRLPVSALPELINIQNLLNANADGNQEDELQLVIEDIQDGSADILLSVVTAASIAVSPGVIEDRQEALHHTLRGVVENPGDPFKGLNESQAEALSHLGRTLSDGQALEVYFDASKYSAVSINALQARDLAETYAVRGLLLPDGADPDKEKIKAQAPKRTRLLGKITAINAEDKKFSFAADNFGFIENGHYEGSSVFEDLRKVLDETSSAQSVALTCYTQMKAGKIWRIKGVVEVDTFSFPVTGYGERLKSFFELPQGWGENEDGQEIAIDIIQAAETFSQKWVELTGISPSSFPLENGGILLEREINGKMLSVELEPDLSCYIHQLDFATRKEVDLETTDQQEALRFMRVVLA